MDQKTVKALNQLNIDFYEKVHEYFNTSRQFNWAGWGKLLSYLPTQAGLKVLDVGCGNGRFGEFLIKNDKKIDYVGIDNNQYLLDIAREKLPKAKLINQNILKPIHLIKSFDLICLFGVLHHVPGKEIRLQLLKALKKLLKPNGLLVFTNWHFNKFKRFNSYIVPFEKVGLKKEDVEENDYILDWKKGVTAYRYCHLMDDNELEEIKRKLKMKLVDKYVADAKSGQGNEYVILRNN
ncbi:MAG: class I SAM-dependent methyltransferase [Candidatus Beckwithbacteria bacterium]|nr:class I SAM-dependent methyltransferase [Patescibacteria group bacterium]